jgi:multisubunit Na+/H+ antiporter MnhC subunit
MEAGQVTIVIGLVLLAIFLFLAKRLFRFAIRLMLAALIFIVLLAVISMGWWQGWFRREPPGKNPARPAPTRRVSSH